MSNEYCAVCGEKKVTSKGKLEGLANTTVNLGSAQSGAPLTRMTVIATYSCPTDAKHPNWEGAPPSYGP